MHSFFELTMFLNNHGGSCMRCVYDEAPGPGFWFLFAILSFFVFIFYNQKQKERSLIFSRADLKREYDNLKENQEDVNRELRMLIDEKSQTEEFMRFVNERYRVLVDHMQDGLISACGDIITFANDAAANMIGFSPEELQGKDMLNYVAESDRDLMMDLFSRLRAGEISSVDIELTLMHHITASPVHVHLHSGMVQMIECDEYIITTIKNITHKVLAEREMRMTQALFDSSAEAMLITDSDKKIIQVNPAFTDITGYEEEEILGHSLKTLGSGRHDNNFYESIWNELSQLSHWRGDIWNRKKDGELYVQRLTLSAIRDEGGGISNYVGVFSDATVEKMEEEAAVHRAYHDALTGLPNRMKLFNRLEEASERAIRNRENFGLIFIDLDDFKLVNDKYGHISGDRLLREVSDRLSRVVEEEDTLARLGGDEFIILCRPGEGEIIDHIKDLSKKVIDRLGTAFRVGDASIQIGCSIGIALYPEDTEDVGRLIELADQAMYASKRTGRNRYSFYREL